MAEERHTGGGWGFGRRATTFDGKLVDTRTGGTEEVATNHELTAKGRTANGRTETYVAAARRGKQMTWITPKQPSFSPVVTDPTAKEAPE